MADRSAPAAGEGIRITRVFDAPRERVWQEWTEPERFADWFGGGVDRRAAGLAAPGPSQPVSVPRYT
jgi:uncharacterized protein YndB with AHSA1/START domain